MMKHSKSHRKIHEATLRYVKGGKFWSLPDSQTPPSRTAIVFTLIPIIAYFIVVIAVMRLFNEVNEWWEYGLFIIGFTSLITIGMWLGPQMKELPYKIDKRLPKIQQFFTR